MGRTILEFLTTALLGLGAFGYFSTVWALGEKGGSLAGNGWRLLEPVTYENLTIFPVVSSHEADTTAFLTLDEGLSSGEVVVSELGALKPCGGRAKRGPSRTLAAPRSTAWSLSIAASVRSCCLRASLSAAASRTA